MVKTIFKTQLTDVDSSARDVVGDIRHEAGIYYKYVKLLNVGTVAGVAGDPVIYAEGATIKGYLNSWVSLDSSDGDTQPTLAGFLLATITGTAATAYYCWIQLTGYVTLPTAVTTGVIGSGCMPTTSSGTDKTLVVATGVINSFAILLTTSGANNKVLACCPF
jgi:hypothetical protein